MVQRPGSEREKSEAAASRRAAWWCLAASCAWLGGAAGCATGVDVSQTELAEICSEPNISCEPGAVAGSGGSSGSGSVGFSGSSGSGTSGNSGSGGAPPLNSAGTSGNSGGSSGSGSSGSAGSSGTSLQPLAMGSCMATSSVVIVYTDRGMGSVTNNQATMVLHVQNDGPAFDLADLTIRYWFTDDGLGDFTSNIDYASQGGGQNLTSSVTVTFGQESGSNYADIGFSTGGSVGPEGVDTIQVRLHTNDYKTMDQSNDFSYQGGASAVANPNITPYVNGTQVGGCVPLP